MPITRHLQLIKYRRAIILCADHVNSENSMAVVKDVYAGDNDQMRNRDSDAREDCIRFCVEADAAPDSLARIIGILAMSNLAPSVMHSDLKSGERMLITAQFDRLSPVTAEFLRRKVQQLTCVIGASVDTASP